MSQPNEQKPNVVSEEDLEHLCQLVEMKDEGPPWMPMMDRSAPNMSYEAWRRDPKVELPFVLVEGFLQTYEVVFEQSIKL